MTEPNSAKPTTNPTALQTANTRLRKRRSGSTGSAARLSAATKPTVSTTLAIARPTICAEPQAYVFPPSVVTSTIDESPAASSAIPV